MQSEKIEKKLWYNRLSCTLTTIIHQIKIVLKNFFATAWPNTGDYLRTSPFLTEVSKKHGNITKSLVNQGKPCKLREFKQFYSIIFLRYFHVW